MECKNIKGQIIKSFQLGNDGVVYGYDNIDDKASVNYECCISLNYEFDPVDGVCYWRKPCEFDDDIKILISPEGEDGLFYQTNDGEDCKLTIDFDYLIELNCDALNKCLEFNDINKNKTGVINSKISNNHQLISENDKLINSLNSELKNVIDKINNKISETNIELKNLKDKFNFNNKEIQKVNKLLLSENDSLKKVEYENILIILNNENELINIEIRDLVKIISDLDVELNNKMVYYGNSINSTKNEKYSLISDNADLNFDLKSISPELTLIDILTSFKLTMSLEVLSETINTGIPFEATHIYSSVLTEKLFDIDNLSDYLNNTDNTGLFLNGNTGNCGRVIKLLYGGLNNEVSFNTLEQGLNSQWVHFNLEINDENLLSLIENNFIKLGLIIENDLCETSILLDNIEFNKTCEFIEKTETFIAKCPSFELDRVIDNKKSWVNNTEFEDREFLLSKRETGYVINNSKLGINSKEIDISLNPSLAIESDFKSFMVDNPCIIDSFSGILTSNVFSEGITVDEFKNILYSELIDVKSRKTISGYPVLRAMYDAYLNSNEICGVDSSKFNYVSMNDFISLIGTYWVDLVEQVIPSTTIWGSTYKYNNTIFDNNKFKYKKNTLFVCKPTTKPVSPIIGLEPSIDVDITTYYYDSNNELVEEVSTCKTTYLLQINDGSEFIGNVSVIGGIRFNKDDGDVIILNESEGSTMQKLN